MPILTIDQSQFIKGSSISPNYPTGGFSPESVGIATDLYNENLGLLSPGKTFSESSANITGHIFASTNYYRSAPYYYSINNLGQIFETNVITKAHSLKYAETTKTYTDNSGIIVYGGNLLITSTTDIYKDDFTFNVNGGGWWTYTKGQPALTAGVPHILFEFNNYLFITDGNKIHRTDITNVKNSLLVLPSGWIITDIEIDKDTIYILASFSSNDPSFNTPSKIFTWNGYSINWQGETNLTLPNINAIVKAESGFIVFGGKAIFYFDGYNYQFLRYVTEDPTRESIVSFNGKIYFRNYKDIWVYNTRFKSFTCPYKAIVGADDYISVINIGYAGRLDYFLNTGSSDKFYSASTAASDVTFYSNWYDLGNIYIRKIEIVFGPNDASPTTWGLQSGAAYTFNLYDEKNSVIYSKSLTYANKGNIIKYTDRLNKQINLLKASVNFGHSACSPIKYIKIYYDGAERNTTKQ